MAKPAPCSAWTVFAPLAMILPNLIAEQSHLLVCSLVHLSTMVTTFLWTSASSQPQTPKYKRPPHVLTVSAFSPIPLLSVHTLVLPAMINYHQHHSNPLQNRATLSIQRKNLKRRKKVLVMVPLW